MAHSKHTVYMRDGCRSAFLYPNRPNPRFLTDRTRPNLTQTACQSEGQNLDEISMYVFQPLVYTIPIKLGQVHAKPEPHYRDACSLHTVVCRLHASLVGQTPLDYSVSLSPSTPRIPAPASRCQCPACSLHAVCTTIVKYCE